MMIGACQAHLLGSSALTHTDAGEPIVPETPADWLDWVAATKTRNHATQDPLLDWLNLYGNAKGFQRDDELHGYDERCDFTRFVFRQAERFEAKAVEHLSRRVEAWAIEDLYRRLGRLVLVDPGPTLITIAHTSASSTGVRTHDLGNLPRVKTTRYFEYAVLRKRPYIERSWCESTPGADPAASAAKRSYPSLDLRAGSG